MGLGLDLDAVHWVWVVIAWVCCIFAVLAAENDGIGYGSEAKAIDGRAFGREPNGVGNESKTPRVVELPALPEHRVPLSLQKKTISTIPDIVHDGEGNFELGFRETKRHYVLNVVHRRRE